MFLCDSILNPSLGSDLFSRGGYSFNTAVGRFSVPRALVSAGHIARFAELLEESVEVHLPRHSSGSTWRVLLATCPATRPACLDPLPAKGELDRQGINGICWLEIVGQRPDGPVVVRNTTEGARREVQSVQAAIGPVSRYPPLRRLHMRPPPAGDGAREAEDVWTTKATKGFRAFRLLSWPSWPRRLAVQTFP